MDQPKRQVLDDFGRAVMTHVRDEAISFLERLVSGKMADATSKELYSELKDFSPSELDVIGRLLVTAADASLVRFLHFVDEFELQLIYHTRSGEAFNIREISDGLAGELYTDNGWIAKFSKFDDRLNSA